ncbi:MAG: hypothetical protein HY908_35840 [Myxococcales bacterium]|nr:hypothetical protein [Myxococcales bacterium]
MLPPFIIEQIRQREERERLRHEESRPRLELPLPLPMPAPPAGEEVEDDVDRGVIIVDLMS